MTENGEHDRAVKGSMGTQTHADPAISPNRPGIRPGRSGRSDRPGRLKLTGIAVLYVLLGVPVTALLICELVFLPLTLLTVGLVGLLIVVPLTAAIANAHRHLAQVVLGEPVSAPYRPSFGGGLSRLRDWARDPARWMDLGWMFVTLVVGWAMALLAVALFLAIFWYALFPALWAITPGSALDQQFGAFSLDSQWASFATWGFALVSFALWWLATPALVRGHALMDRAMLSNRTRRLEQRVATLAETRAESVDFSAAELRRIERDLHDGAQARLVSLGMSLGLADDLLERDPRAARQLLAEAVSTTNAALGEIRTVVRGMHPPVLADRGLVGAVQALALDMALAVDIRDRLAGRPPLPVESACYFAVAESLANVAKHSGAQHAWVELRHDDGLLHIAVGDDGRGGADAGHGTGLSGVARRLSAFDGTMTLSSPSGGPTAVVMEVPCALSSPKITPSSGTG